jgi:hypothetical protein
MAVMVKLGLLEGGERGSDLRTYRLTEEIH